MDYNMSRMIRDAIHRSTERQLRRIDREERTKRKAKMEEKIRYIMSSESKRPLAKEDRMRKNGFSVGQQGRRQG